MTYFILHPFPGIDHARLLTNLIMKSQCQNQYNLSLSFTYLHIEHPYLNNFVILFGRFKIKNRQTINSAQYSIEVFVLAAIFRVERNNVCKNDLV